MKRRKRSIKRFVLDEQEDEATNELLNNGTSRIIEFTNSDSPLIAKFGEQILGGEFIKTSLVVLSDQTNYNIKLNLK